MQSCIYHNLNFLKYSPYQKLFQIKFVDLNKSWGILYIIPTFVYWQILQKLVV
jgi:hypothetical protein